MKTSDGSSRRRVRRTRADQRAQLLVAFDRSGLSAAAFARQHGLNYTTFCGWRQRRSRTKPSPAFVQVELPSPPVLAELVIELSACARMRITSASQIELTAQLLRRLNVTASC
jgi:transposase-like protein